MTRPEPEPISAAERARRLTHATRSARRLGFVGRVEYRHVFSGAGGAQFGLGSSAANDLLVVYAEAFARDANPKDFSLDAIIAHERGHQFVCRSAALKQCLGEKIGLNAEEIVASLVGSLLVQSATDCQALVLKALDEAIRCGVEISDAMELVFELRRFLEDRL